MAVPGFSRFRLQLRRCTRPSCTLTAAIVIGAVLSLTLVILYKSTSMGRFTQISLQGDASEEVRMSADADHQPQALHHQPEHEETHDNQAQQKPAQTETYATVITSDDMEYKTYSQPGLPPPQNMVADLDPQYLPWTNNTATTTSERKKRLVVVGDVHGQLTTLQALLHKISFQPHTGDGGDHLLLTGDMVAKGPDSPGVVKLVMDLGASCSAVRGNHEDKVLAAYRKHHHKHHPKHKSHGDDDDDDDDDDKVQKEDGPSRVARSLSRKQIDWLSALPLILRLQNPPHHHHQTTDGLSPPWNAGQIIIVHGGLVPGVPLEKQDPWAVMNMRCLTYPKHKHTVAVPVDSRDGEPWSRAWNRFQNTQISKEEERMVVIYGHDAKMGLQVDITVKLGEIETSTDGAGDGDIREEGETERGDGTVEEGGEVEASRKRRRKGTRYAFGLDSGCGHGRKLTALIIETEGGHVTHRIEQVDCLSPPSKH
ncbi:Metallo-dependent phosphatase-like protein [Diplogelasinospora grovesii]|uniref:Metallo-dependent phosphatase-like protein n=1 Tax=Diplogelasinospora grovesii TaxID=303347 RepID=A0AAN6S7B9_9PEZI|nr:Metallo-dependent phosphatase-like protein [Diplogelasinospora grovesii]